MRDINSPRADSPRRRQPGLTPWLFLFLAPFVGMVLLLPHVGGAWLDRGAIHPVGAAILPGITLEAVPAAPSSPRASAPQSRLVITSIRSGSAATQHGLAVGDTVVAIDGARIFSLDQARRRLQKAGMDTVALRVMHGRDVRDVRLAGCPAGARGRSETWATSC